MSLSLLNVQLTVLRTVVKFVGTIEMDSVLSEL